MGYLVTFFKESVPVGRCGLVRIGSHNDHESVSPYC